MRLAWIACLAALGLVEPLALRPPRVLLIDCHDSYTQNVAQWLAAASSHTYGGSDGHWPLVVQHDDPTLCAALRERGADALCDVDVLVLSPGPGHPSIAADFEHTAAGLALRAAPEDLVVLGVCLGHQGMALFDGFSVERLPEPRHGIVDCVFYEKEAVLFQGLPQGFEATRYHSLTARASTGHAFDVVARTKDGEVQAIQHKTLPRYGVQFHPESIATPLGFVIARNLFKVVDARGRRRARPEALPAAKAAPRATDPGRPSAWTISASRVPLEVVADSGARCAALYAHLFSADAASPSFWLDGDGSAAAPVSILGDGGGDVGFVFEHDATKHVTKRHSHQSAETLPGDLLPRLREWTADYGDPAVVDRETGLEVELPFSFKLGFVGYLGYELRSETRDFSPNFARHKSEQPDAAMLLCARAVVVDHRSGVAWILQLQKPADAKGRRPSADDDAKWFDAARAAVRAAYGGDVRRAGAPALEALAARTVFSPRDDSAAYRDKIRLAQESIDAGDAYEVCLTTAFEARLGARGAEADVSTLDWYAALRQRNFAPRAALVDLGPKLGGLAVASSSPETFLKATLRGDILELESKPIKGTLRRVLGDDDDGAEKLAACPKSRAEHLMIADLVRNDLQRVCDSGSVAALKFCTVESFATVHQLVSTVRGDLRGDLDVFDAISATFPPGSMTGAPKRRACELIDSLETGARGVYSGALGFIALDGQAHLAVVIRAALFHRNGDDPRVTVGAGGAITALSDVDEEWSEVRLKATSVVGAFGAALAADAPAAGAPAAGDAPKAADTQRQFV
ncbi:ADC synthase [Pelagophyceae sp. CCMP2097]|nr:ADC synthase [Pelagophyceae sp. CCMP2097]